MTQGDISIAGERPLLGHPRGLYVLVLTEMWERFSYYGMRALLVFYLSERFAFSDSMSFTVYGSYTALVYVSPLLGGMLADRYLGSTKAVTLGAILMMVGHVGLASEDLLFGSLETGAEGPRSAQLQLFYLSLAFLIVGVGMLKPNISTMVGGLYPRDGASRDAGFTLFVWGITFGATTSAIVCGYVGQTYGWGYGFGLAALGMLFGLLIFRSGQRHLRHVGQPPEPVALREMLSFGIRRETFIVIAIVSSVFVVWPLLQMFHLLGYVVAASFAVATGGVLVFASLHLQAQQREQLVAALLLMTIWVCFAALVEQAGSSINLFTERLIDRGVGQVSIRSAQLQGLLPLLTFCLSPLFAWLWGYLEGRGGNPSTSVKFALSLVLLALGYACISFGTLTPDDEGRVQLVWLVLLYACFAIGDLLILPVGLSAMTKLAVGKVLGFTMALWMLSVAIGNYFAALIARRSALPQEAQLRQAELLDHYREFFTSLALLALLMAVLAFALAPLIKRCMHGVR